ncbi:MAG: Ig-like domain-containing protein, partial [Candidatus Limnocylindrales bacterium]|nr:Ig-like domain-containing protein [Candidatus Limnocylindrales bacterium]
MRIGRDLAGASDKPRMGCERRATWQRYASAKPGLAVAVICGLLSSSLWAAFGTVVHAAEPPVAFDQSASTRESTPLEMSLEASDPDLDTLTFGIVDTPTHGAIGGLDCAAFGDCVYTPAAGYVGPDGFTFRANDGTTDSNLATVSLTIFENSAPVAFDRSAAVEQDTPRSIALSAADPDFDSVTFAIIGSPTHGTLDGTDCADFGDCLYTPEPGYLGPDSFTFSANDGLLESNIATVAITVRINTPPVAEDISVNVVSGAAMGFSMPAEDLDADQLTFSIVDAPVHGILFGTPCPAEGSCSYLSDTGYVGPDSFTFRANDGFADSNLATVSIVVSSALDPSAIVSSGPLTRIETTPDLNCAVNHASDLSGEFFGDTACATLVGVDGVLYGPASIPAGPSVDAPFTAVSQSAVTGTGSESDPLRIITVVDLGSTGLRLTQTDSYVIGQEAYRTDIAIANAGPSARTLLLYRAGDCFLQNSDEGYGSADPSTGAVACVTSLDSGARIQQWFPLSAGSHYYEAGFGEVWGRVASLTPFPDTCRCNELIDNGAGLSWEITVPAGGAVTRSQFTGFSPIGRVPLTTAKVADAGTTPAGGSNGYTITFSNPNAFTVSLSSVFDDLPTGFSYVVGSTSGATSAEPAISGGRLTWSGPIAVGASADISIHFAVTVASLIG